MGGEVVGVGLLVDDFADAGVDDHLGADDAGLVCAVESGAVYADAELGGLDDGVLLCVDGEAQLVPGAGGDAQISAHAFAFLFAAFDAGGGAVVAGGYDALVAHDDGTDVSVWLIAA